MAHPSFSPAPQPQVHPLPSMLQGADSTETVRLYHMCVLTPWLPVWLCQLETQQEIKGPQERTFGVFLPISLPVLLLIMTLSLSKYAPVMALCKPPLLTRLQLLPAGPRVITVSRYCWSLDASAAPLVPLLLTTLL